jgi:hypothetical protein
MCFLSPTDLLGLLSLSWIEGSQTGSRHSLSRNDPRVTPSNREWSITYRKVLFILDEIAVVIFKEIDKFKNPAV